MLTIEEMRNRVGEIVNKLEKLSKVENHTDEQLQEINALTEEFETLKNKIEAKEKVQNVLDSANVGTRKVNASAPSKPKIEVEPHATKQNGGFKSAGEFYAKVAQGGNDPRFKNQAFEKYGEDGGFLIPEDFRTEIQKKVESDESLMSLTKLFKTNSNHLVLPVNETAPWDASGIQSYWEGEGDQYKSSKSKFGLDSKRLHKLTSLVNVSDEMLEDAAALESWIKMEAPESINHKINSAIISGSGAGQPQGILNSGFTLDVDKEVAQPADTIVYNNLINMEARLMGQGVWIAHASVKEQLRKLKDDNGNLIYMNGGQFPNAAAAPFDTLLGKRIIYMMGSMEALGDRGDILLCNMNYYHSAMKQSGIKQQISTHVYFDKDLTAFKFTSRIAGGCPYKAPVTTEKGNYQMSGFVALNDRA